MKTEDFERLKKLCDENGFQLVTESPKENDKFFVVKKKDEWEGVEFVEFWNGRIRKIKSTNGSMVYCTDEIYTSKNNCKPSTEQAYVEQLKKEAFERFGEIKEGDRFIEADGETWVVRTGFKECGNTKWHYIKESDTLFHYALLIYRKGKWAERVKERVIVEFFDDSVDENNSNEEWGYSFIVKNYKYGCEKSKQTGKFLAEQLEKYINEEI